MPGTQSEPSLHDDLNATLDEAEGLSAVEEPEVPEAAEAAPEAPEVPELPPLNAPNSWKKELAPRWGELPREIQEEILRREEDSTRGFTQKGQELAQLRQQHETFQQTLQPVAQQWVKQGINPAEGLKSLVAWFQAIETDPKAALMELARIRGVDLKAELADQPYVDPQVAQMQKQYEQKLAQMEQQLNGFSSQQQQAKQHAALQQIHAFEGATNDDGSPKYPHFNAVWEDMAFLMQAGRAQNLDSAYQMAIRMSDSVQQQIAQANVQQAAQAKSQQAQKAKAAAQASVSSKEAVDIDESDLGLRDALSREFDRATA